MEEEKNKRERDDSRAKRLPVFLCALACGRGRQLLYWRVREGRGKGRRKEEAAGTEGEQKSNLQYTRRRVVPQFLFTARVIVHFSPTFGLLFLLLFRRSHLPLPPAQILY